MTWRTWMFLARLNQQPTRVYATAATRQQAEMTAAVVVYLINRSLDPETT